MIRDDIVRAFRGAVSRQNIFPDYTSEGNFTGVWIGFSSDEAKQQAVATFNPQRATSSAMQLVKESSVEDMAKRLGTHFNSIIRGDRDGGCFVLAAGILQDVTISDCHHFLWGYETRPGKPVWLMNPNGMRGTRVALFAMASSEEARRLVREKHMSPLANGLVSLSVCM